MSGRRTFSEDNEIPGSDSRGTRHPAEEITPRVHDVRPGLTLFIDCETTTRRTFSCAGPFTGVFLLPHSTFGLHGNITVQRIPARVHLMYTGGAAICELSILPASLNFIATVKYPNQLIRPAHQFSPAKLFPNVQVL